MQQRGVKSAGWGNWERMQGKDGRAEEANGRMVGERRARERITGERMAGERRARERMEGGRIAGVNDGK